MRNPSLIGLGAIALGATALGAIALAPSAWSQVSPATGSDRAPAVVSDTVSYDSLTIAPGEVPIAPAGKTLTLTVDGVQTDLIPGTYKGKVVLSHGCAAFKETGVTRFSICVVLICSAFARARGMTVELNRNNTIARTVPRKINGEVIQ